MTNPKLVSGNTGSVTTSSSPLDINSLNGLSKFTLVAFSNATGFLMYSVLTEEVTLGARLDRIPCRTAAGAMYSESSLMVQTCDVLLLYKQDNYASVRSQRTGVYALRSHVHPVSI